MVAIKFGFGSLLCKGKILAPLTSVVLSGNHLVRFVNRMLAYIFFLRVIGMLKRKNKMSQKGFIKVLDKIVGLTSMYPRVRRGIESHIVLCKKLRIGWLILLNKCLCRILAVKHCFYAHNWRFKNLFVLQ